MCRADRGGGVIGGGRAGRLRAGRRAAAVQAGERVQGRLVLLVGRRGDAAAGRAGAEVVVVRPELDLRLDAQPRVCLVEGLDVSAPREIHPSCIPTSGLGGRTRAAVSAADGAALAAGRADAKPMASPPQANAPPAPATDVARLTFLVGAARGWRPA